MLRRGMSVDEFAPRLSFNFTAWGKIFEEVAKFRAGRRLYARMMRERFGAASPKSWMFRSLIGGGGFVYTVADAADKRGDDLTAGTRDATKSYDDRDTFGTMSAALLGVGAAVTIGGSYVDEFTIPDSDSQKALDLLEDSLDLALAGKAS